LESAKAKGCADVVELEDEVVLVVVELEDTEVEDLEEVELVVEEDTDGVLVVDVL
jgi:hypothetical protein